MPPFFVRYSTDGLSDFYIWIVLYCDFIALYRDCYTDRSLFLMGNQKSVSLFAVMLQFCHKWMVTPEYTTQRVPGFNSRCRASHLSFILITLIHFTLLTCTICLWKNNTDISTPFLVQISLILFLIIFKRGVIRRPSFFSESLSKTAVNTGGFMSHTMFATIEAFFLVFVVFFVFFYVIPALTEKRNNKK